MILKTIQMNLNDSYYYKNKTNDKLPLIEKNNIELRGYIILKCFFIITFSKIFCNLNNSIYSQAKSLN